jgi:hypothetical protein
MSNLINDGSLIGLWPMLEPSGSPVFKNYSPARAKQPSGISFDFHVAVSQAPGREEMQSVWPGTDTILESSGRFTGFRPFGIWEAETDSAPFSKYLVLGQANDVTRRETLVPNVAQSGFTVGYWVFPIGDGYPTFDDDVASFVNTFWDTYAARSHTIVGQFNATTSASTSVGWYLGVSGQRAGAAGNAFNPSQIHALQAFAVVEKTGTPVALATPIESGRYTHITMSYRYINGTSNELVLYKDGRVEASGTTDRDFTLNDTNILAETLTIGGSTDGADSVHTLDRTTGWGSNIVSGVYFFRRPLHEGEILALHECGGLQPEEAFLSPTAEVSLTDSKLLGYYPFMSVGYEDASHKHRPLIGPKDMGDNADGYIPTSGPFKAGAVLNDEVSNASDAMVAVSGLCYEITEGRSWTIAGYWAPENSAEREDNMLFSWGSVSTQTNANLDPTAVSEATFGICCTIRTAPTERMVIEAYPLGDLDGRTEIFASGQNDFHHYVASHYAVVYDDETTGLAFYVNGALQGSGVLTHSLTDQLHRVTGSGYPLIFHNGVTNQPVDSSSKGIHADGGRDLWGTSFTVFGRPLSAPEIRYLAVSGINTAPVWRTVHDPRLMGYWPADDFKLSDIVVPDKSRVWGDISPGHLVRGDSFTKWERVYDRDHNEAAGSVFTPLGTAAVDLFKPRPTVPELSSFGNLGITSGIFAPFGASLGPEGVSDLANSRSAIANPVMRYKPIIEESDLTCQNPLGEWVIAFEVTPSGSIPNTDIGIVANANKTHFNSTLFTFGKLGTSSTGGEFKAFLTSKNAAGPDPVGADAGTGASGISVVFLGRDGSLSPATNVVPLVSGNLPFGIPTKVLFHTKFDNPYDAFHDTVGTAPMTVNLYVDGQKIAARKTTAAAANMWSDDAVDSADDWFIQFGGEAATDLITTQLSMDGGLGDIHMRNIFWMRGGFDNGEIQALASSGIQTPTLANYVNNLPTTQLTLADSNLEGYWRFNGEAGGGSGTTDLSLKLNHLTPIAQNVVEDDIDAGSQGALFLRFLPGPMAQADIAIQASGITYSSRQVSNVATDRVPPLAASGASLNPKTGFTIGFMHAKRDDVANNRFDTLMAYGVLGATSISDTSLDANRGWAIGMDDSENMVMVMSHGGNMYLDTGVSNTAHSGQTVCGAYNGSVLGHLDDNRLWDQFRLGDFDTNKLDFWSHWCWVFDPTDDSLTCYMNGNVVDKRTIRQEPDKWVGPNIPEDPTARMITFLQHQEDPWDFNTINLNDFDSVITEVSYFSRALTAAEVRYLAFNGIDLAQGTVGSGIVGGYVQGQDTGSGIMGGYQRGQDTASGILGGYMPGAITVSGVVGGYVSGVVFVTGQIGGYVQGLGTMSGILGGLMRGGEVASGVVAGYIAGQETGSGILGGLMLGAESASGIMGGFMFGVNQASGILGGFMLGGLTGQVDFDATFGVNIRTVADFDSLVEIAQTDSADFDAKVVIFENEIGPLTQIIIPESNVSGLAPPFNQYFIAKASGQQGKSITKTRWNFGDLTPPVEVTQSGAGCYPVQHNFASSGFYVVKFEAIDSDGQHSSDTIIVNAASGIDPVLITVSGVPRSGLAELIVDFETKVETIPAGVSVTAQLLQFDDGQTTIRNNPTHTYTEPGVYRPVWCVRDSRGVFWCDSLEAGPDLLTSGGN